MTKRITLLIFLICSVFLQNCKDPCKDVTCVNGNCLDGTCLCSEGYEGTNCDVETRAKYYGEWSGVPDCDNETLPIQEITVTVSEGGSGIYDVVFDLNLQGLPTQLPPQTTTLYGNAFEIPSVSIQVFNFEIVYSAIGYFKSDQEMKLKFSVFADNEFLPLTLNCDAVLTK